MPDQTGEWINVGGRLTYHPPFVNERDGFPQPWDQCVTATAVNLINVAFLGQKPATSTEVKALRDSIPDRQPDDGWHTSHMIRMVRARYGLDLEQENIDKPRMIERLSSGWAVSVGINLALYPQQPWDSGAKSMGGHRILLLGYRSDTNEVKVMDPMFTQGKGYRGRFVNLNTVWNAMKPGRSDWRPQQVWIREAERVITTMYVLATLTPPRTVTLNGAQLHDLYDIDHQDDQPSKKVSSISAPINRTFDQIVQIAQQPNQCFKPEGGPFLRLKGSNVEGYYIDSSKPGVTADLSLPACADNICEEAYQTGLVDGSNSEENDWIEWLADAPRLVARQQTIQMTDIGVGVDDDGVGWTDADTLTTAEPESTDPRVPPQETIS